MQTSMQELIERLKTLSEKYQNAGLLTAIEIANSLLAMEKQQIIDAYHTNPQEAKWKNIGINYYNETYGSNHIVDTNEMIDHIGDANKMVEISDEEIEEASRRINYGGGSMGWIKDAFKKGAKWYREQLKLSSPKTSDN